MSLQTDQVRKHFEDAVVSREELDVFFHDGVLIGNLRLIWDNVINSLPEDLKKEAFSKKVLLEEMIEMRGRFDKTYQFKVVGASKELQGKLELVDNFAIFYEE